MGGNTKKMVTETGEYSGGRDFPGEEGEKTVFHC